MVYSIDKLDGTVVSLIADKVDVKQIENDYVVVFYRWNCYDINKPTKNTFYMTYDNNVVASYYLSNIVGFREVKGVNEEMLAQTYEKQGMLVNMNLDNQINGDYEDDSEIH